MNYVIPGILLEEDLTKLDEGAIDGLYKIMHRGTASMLRRYMESEEAKPECVSFIEKHFKKRIDSILVVKDRQKSGLMDKLRNINIQSIDVFTADEILKDVNELLSYKDIINSKLYKPSKDDYDSFVKEFARCSVDNCFSLNDVRRRVEANKEMIFDKTAYSSDKQMDFIRRKIEDAYDCIKVAQYFEYCAKEKVSGEGAWIF